LEGTLRLFRRKPRLKRRTDHTWNPVRLLVGSYLAAVGLLTLGFRYTETTLQGGMVWVDAFFTSTSAVTVTGLVVLDTAELSKTGQTLLSSGVLLGGMGLATIGVLFGMMFMRSSLKNSLSFNADLAVNSSSQSKLMLYTVLLTTFLVSSLGALLMKLSTGLGWFDAWFMALSTFTNAGFSTVNDGFANPVFTSQAVLLSSLLVIIGGLGYPVVLDVYLLVRYKMRLSLTTKVMLWGSILLLGVGFGFFYLFEPASLQNTEQSWILTVMSRNAGFSQLDMSMLSDPGQLLLSVLMFIGAGPAATAGGLKITGAYVILLTIAATLAANKRVNTGRKHIDTTIVLQACSVAGVLIGTIMLGMVLLTSVENISVMHALFEMTSATTTTGLSYGTNQEFSIVGKTVLSLGMLVGRIVPLMLAITALTAKSQHVKLPNTRLLLT